MTSLMQDLRYGLRMLRRGPGFALVVVLTLAIGIGANTALFSVVHGVLLRPLPYDDPDRLALLAHENLKEGIAEDPMSWDTFLDFREQSEAFDSIAGISTIWALALAGKEGPERISAHWVSAGFFETLGVAPRFGRSFLPEEDRRGEPMTIVLSHALFEGRFGADPEIVGKIITIDDAPARVVGVMPPGFRLLEEVEAWVPLALNEVGARGRSVRFVKAVVRLRPGVSLDAAREEARTIAARLEERHPDSNTGMSATLTGLHERITGGARGALLILMGVVGFVLLIACANVAGLLTARAAARSNEVAVRVALGAGRIRLVRQLLTESIVLGLLGGAAGLALATWGLELIRLFAPADLPRREEMAIDPTVLVFTLLASLGTGILFGIAPALLITRPDAGRALQAAGRSALGTHGSRTRRILVVAEVALALVLLIGAGLMVRSFGRLLAVDPGFAAGDVLTLKVGLPGSLDAARRRTFYRQMHERLNALPGVLAAGAVTRLPLGSGVTTTLDIEGRDAAAGRLPEVELRRASFGYFDAMKIPLLSGRSFGAADDAEAPPVLLVNRTAARKFWPGEDPVGRRARIFSSDTPWFTIVGVVGDVKHFGLDQESPAEIYMSFEQGPPSHPQFAVRATGDPTALIAPVRAALRELEPAAVIFDVMPMAERLSGSLAARRFNMILLGSFSGIALLLAAVGIYGVLAYAVRQRTREIGVRVALGARRGDILRLVVRQGMSLVAAGLVIGLAGALALTRLMSGLLFDVSPADLATYLAVPPFLLAVSLVACWLPARRAASVDPMEALRQD